MPRLLVGEYSFKTVCTWCEKSLKSLLFGDCTRALASLFAAWDPGDVDLYLCNRLSLKIKNIFQNARFSIFGTLGTWTCTCARTPGLQIAVEEGDKEVVGGGTGDVGQVQSSSCGAPTPCHLPPLFCLRSPHDFLDPTSALGISGGSARALFHVLSPAHNPSLCCCWSSSPDPCFGSSVFHLPSLSYSAPPWHAPCEPEERVWSPHCCPRAPPG